MGIITWPQSPKTPTMADQGRPLGTLFHSRPGVLGLAHRGALITQLTAEPGRCKAQLNHIQARGTDKVHALFWVLNGAKLEEEGGREGKKEGKPEESLTKGMGGKWKDLSLRCRFGAGRRRRHRHCRRRCRLCFVSSPTRRDCGRQIHPRLLNASRVASEDRKELCFGSSSVEKKKKKKEAHKQNVRGIKTGAKVIPDY